MLQPKIQYYLIRTSFLILDRHLFRVQFFGVIIKRIFQYKIHCSIALDTCDDIIESVGLSYTIHTCIYFF